MVVVERRRTLYQVDCLLLGIMLLCKQEQLGNRKFASWFRQNMKGENRVIAARSAAINNEDGTIISLRTARVYKQLAKRFLSNLEQGKFEGEFEDTRACEQALQDCENLPSLPEDRRQVLESQLGKFIAGRSLDRMLKDFRQAEKDEVKSNSQECSGGEKAGETYLPPEQLRLGFKEDLFTYFKNAEDMLWSSFADPRISYLRKEDFKELSEYHQAQVSRLRNLIREMEG